MKRTGAALFLIVYASASLCGCRPERDGTQDNRRRREPGAADAMTQRGSLEAGRRAQQRVREAQQQRMEALETLRE